MRHGIIGFFVLFVGLLERGTIGFVVLFVVFFGRGIGVAQRDGRHRVTDRDALRD